MLRDAIRTVLLRDLDGVVREVEAYDSDEALWRPILGLTNSGGVLARHLAGNLHHFVGHVLGGAAYQRNREDEFDPKGPLTAQPMSRAAVVAELRAAQRAVERALGGDEDATLSRDGNATPSGDQNAMPSSHEDVSLSGIYPQPLAGHHIATSRFLVHLVAHLGYHLGQIDYHRRVQQGGIGAVGTLPLDRLR